MDLFRGLTVFLLVSFIAALVWAGLTGDFWPEVQMATQSSWGKVMLLDLYIGFLIFSALIVKFEKSVIKAGIWVISLMILGNAVALIYLLLHFSKIRQVFQKGDSNA